MSDQFREKQSAEPEWIEAAGPAHFPAGLPGFEEYKRFMIVSRNDMRPFLWLRSMDDPELALPIISCLLLNKPVLPHITKEQLSLVGNPSSNEIAPYYILRVDTKEGVITANTKAPVIINSTTKQGYQIFMDSDDLRVDEPLRNLVPASKVP